MFSNYDISDRHKLSLHLIITLQSPLSHIGEVTGNVSNLKTLKLIDIEGNPRQCFAYSGNALRNGILRRRGVAAALSHLGLCVEPNTHHALFCGGRIDGSTGSDMELDKRIRQLMPWLSVLGTAKPAGVFGVKNAQMVQGRLNVGSAYLVCYESAPYVYEQFPAALPPESLEGIGAIARAKSALSSDPFVPPSQEAIAQYTNAKAQYLPYLRKTLRSWTEYIAIDQTTRRDSTHDPNLQRFLPPDRPLLAGEGNGKEKKSDQMISSDRLIMARAKLYSRWDFYGTGVEAGWIVEALLKFGENPYLGGKANRGNGLVSMDFWYDTHDSDKGFFLSVGNGQKNMSIKASDAHIRYQEYLQVYRDYLDEAKESQELKGLLGANT